MRDVSFTAMVVHLCGKGGGGRGSEDAQTAATRGMAAQQSALQLRVKELSMHSSYLISLIIATFTIIELVVLMLIKRRKCKK